MASTISKNKKNHEAAVKALDAAEAYFKSQKLDSAIKQATQAKNLDPELPNVDNFITAYKIQRAVSCKKNWYVVLDIPECTHSLNISKRYKQLALMVHPDKNVSAAAEGAFKHIKDALDYLSDPVRKKDYDTSLEKNRKRKAYFAPAGRKAATSATEASCKAADVAAAKATEAKAQRKAAAAAAARKTAADRKTNAASWKAAAEAARKTRAAKRREAAAAAAAREAAGAGEFASWKAAAEATAAREARAAALKKADAAAAAEMEARAAAARREMNARKQQPTSEIEHGISLIMKYSPKYMQPKFSVR